MNSRQRIVQARFLDNEERVIKRLNQVYNRCWSDTTALYERLSDDVKGLTGAIKLLDKDDPQRAVLQSRLQAKIYQRDFQRQLGKQLEGIVDNMFLSEYKTVSDYLTGCYDEGFIGTLYDLHGQGVPFSIPINQQAVVHAVQLDSKISEGLYTRLGENTKLLKQKIMAQTSRMMVLGTSYAEASKQLSNYTNIGFNRSVRIMRTEGHRIQCQASMDALTDAKEMGADVVKQWDATLDGKTRPTHIMVDGEIRELEEPFSNGLMFAGDPNGEAREVINCRCALLNRARWGLEDGFTKYDSFEDKLVTFESPEHYDHFKKWYFSDDNKKYMQFVQNLEDKYETRNFADILGRMTGKEYDTFKKLEANRPKYTPMTKVVEPTAQPDNAIKYKPDYGSDLAEKFGHAHYDEMHKRVVDCADETASAVWKKYESQIKVGDANYRGHDHCQGSRIYVNGKNDSLGNSFQRPYQVSFHESGHAIDYLVRDLGEGVGMHYSATYKNGLFPQTIENEVKAWVDRYDRELKALFKRHKGDLQWFRNNGFIDDWPWDMYKRGLYSEAYIMPKYKKSMAYGAVQKEIKSIGSMHVYGDLSDIVEGASGGKIQCGIGHGASYWKQRKFAGVNGGLATEAFAEMLDSTFANHESLELLRKNFQSRVLFSTKC